MYATQIVELTATFCAGVGSAKSDHSVISKTYWEPENSSSMDNLMRLSSVAGVEFISHFIGAFIH